MLCWLVQCSVEYKINRIVQMHLDDSFSPSWGCFNAEKLCSDKIYQRNCESL